MRLFSDPLERPLAEDIGWHRMNPSGSQSYLSLFLFVLVDSCCKYHINMKDSSDSLTFTL